MILLDVVINKRCEKKNSSALATDAVKSNVTKDAVKPNATKDAPKQLTADIDKTAGSNPGTIIVVDEVLNFLKNSHATSTCVHLKPVLISFYNEEER